MGQKEEKTEKSAGDSPIGTWVLLCVVAAAMTAAWLFLYFGVFLPRGVVS